jgi:hypothetical protein
MNPTDPKTPEPPADLHGLVGDRITAGEPGTFQIEPDSQFFSLNLWECTPRLRWISIDIAVPMKLQQLWTCRQTGATEWRDVEVEG